MNRDTIIGWLEEFQRFAPIVVAKINEYEIGGWSTHRDGRRVDVGLSMVTGSPWADFYYRSSSWTTQRCYYLPSEYDKLKEKIGQWLFQGLR
jgi:hypothetical protein